MSGPRWALAVLALAVVAAGCGDDSRSDRARLPERPAEESVERLLNEPDRFDAAQAACREGGLEENDARCRVAAEAERRRFRGSGATYKPGNAEAFPSRPARQPLRQDAGR